MVIASFDSKEEEIRNFINQIADICLSQEFIDLKLELEEIYTQNGMENALLTAFQDAIYTILVQQEGCKGNKNILYKI